MSGFVFSMRQRFFLIDALVAVQGGLLAWYFPNGPLLSYWLVAALLVGGYLAWSRRVVGLTLRATNIVWLYVALVPAALLSTHMAARRLTSESHVRYEGVH